VLQIARIVDDPALIRQAARRHGWCLLCEGRIAEGRALLESALIHRSAADGRTPILNDRVVNDDDASTLGHLAWVDWLTQGREAALQRAALAAASVGEEYRPFSAAYALGVVAIVHQLARDPAGAAHFAARCGAIAEARGMVYWVAMARALAGWSAAMAGEPAGLVQLRAAIQEYRHTQGEVLRPYLLGLLAEAEQTAGSRDAALAALDEAAAVAERIGVELFRAPLLLLRSRLLTGASRQQILAEARRIAELQGAPALAGLLDEELGR
jgi:hypothetical protein